jgi:hypothetical protein
MSTYSDYSNEAVVRFSIVTFCGVVLIPAILSGSDTDWAYAQQTVLTVLPLVLILVVNRLVGPARSGQRSTLRFLRFRITPSLAQRSDAGSAFASDRTVRPHRRK